MCVWCVQQRKADQCQLRPVRTRHSVVRLMSYSAINFSADSPRSSRVRNSRAIAAVSLVPRVLACFHVSPERTFRTVEG